MKTLSVAVIASILLVAVCIAEFSFTTKANPEIYAGMPKLQIESPNKSRYETGDVPVKVKGEVLKRYYINESSPCFWCYLDGKEFAVNASYEGETADGWVVLVGETTLSLAKGKHTFSVWQISCSQLARALNSVTAVFYVNKSAPTATPTLQPTAKPTIALSTTNPTPSQIEAQYVLNESIAVASTVVAVAGVSISLLLYRKKCKS